MTLVECIYCDALGPNAPHRYWCPEGPDRAAENIDEVEEYVKFRMRQIQLYHKDGADLEEIMRHSLDEMYMGLSIGGKFPQKDIDAIYNQFKLVRVDTEIVGSLPKIIKPKGGLCQAHFQDGEKILGKHDTLMKLLYLNTPAAIEWRGRNGLGVLAAGWQLRTRGMVIKVRHIE